MSAPHNGSSTSIAAAAAIAPHAQTLMGEVFDFIESQRVAGATIDETHIATRIATATVCGRFDDLKKAGRIVPSGDERKTSSGRNAAVMVTAAFKIRRDRKVVAAQIAKMAQQGATRSDLLRVLTTVKPVDLDARLRECGEYDTITQMRAETRQGERVHHITKRGLVALGWDLATHWHADQMTVRA